MSELKNPIARDQAMHQSAPYPVLLAGLIGQLEYKDGWEFELQPDTDRGQGSTGLTLLITVRTPNSYRPGQMIGVRHLMIVPAAAYDGRAWQRWLLEQILLVERHECLEFFRVDGHRPYAPVHAPGADPYTITEYASTVEKRTSFRGELNPGEP